MRAGYVVDPVRHFTVVPSASKIQTTFSCHSSLGRPVPTASSPAAHAVAGPAGSARPVRAREGLDLIREAVRVALQDLIELEATEVIGAARYEWSETRRAERNGSRARLPTTKAGDVHLAIPKLRKGSFFPEMPEPRRRID